MPKGLPPKGLPYSTRDGSIYDCNGNLLAEFLHRYTLDAEYLVLAANNYDHLQQQIEDLKRGMCGAGSEDT